MPSVHNIAECGWGENSTKNTKGGQRKYLFFAILLLNGAFFGFILLNSFDFSNQSWFGFQLHCIICYLKDYSLKLPDSCCYYLSVGPRMESGQGVGFWAI